MNCNFREATNDFVVVVDSVVHRDCFTATQVERVEPNLHLFACDATLTFAIYMYRVVKTANYK